MEEHRSTSWTVIEGAAAGNQEHRAVFARVYLPVVRKTLRARWTNHPLASELEDAVQDVFVECLRPGGVTTRVERDDGRSFRNYLWGVTRNVARTFEKRRRPGSIESLDLPGGDESYLGSLFDRSYAVAIVTEALRVLIRTASEEDAAAARRVELLRLRLYEDRPIREIAREWDVDAGRLHHDYARARADFRDCLRDTLAAHHGRSGAAAEEELLELVRGAE